MPPVKIQVERVKIPADLLDCQDAPEAPDASLQSQVASYLISLWDSGEDCRTKLQQVKGLVEAR